MSDDEKDIDRTIVRVVECCASCAFRCGPDYDVMWCEKHANAFVRPYFLCDSFELNKHPVFNLPS